MFTAEVIEVLQADELAGSPALVRLLDCLADDGAYQFRRKDLSVRCFPLPQISQVTVSYPLFPMVTSLLIHRESKPRRQGTSPCAASDIRRATSFHDFRE